MLLLSSLIRLGYRFVHRRAPGWLIVGSFLARVLLNSLQDAQLSQRDRAAGWVSYGPKWKTGTARQYLRTL